MKTYEMTVAAESLTAEKKQLLHTWAAIVMLAALLMLLSLPLNAMASRERYILQFNDSRISGSNGQAATLFLKKSLKQQYPHLEIENLDLRQVVLVAKSHVGSGGAQLRVGKWETKRYPVEGHPQIFNDNRAYSFDRVQLFNPSTSSNGPWQVNLNGNFVVRKVILDVENHSWSRHRMGWRHSIR